MKNFVKYLLAACVMLVWINTGVAQNCSGNLGVPVVNIDFGNAAHPPKRLPTYSEGNYYLAGVCPPGGSYTFDSVTAHCFNDTWITLTQDHTPADTGGYMMQVNPDSLNIYIDTIRLCGGTTYEFSAWLINLDSVNACGGGRGLIRPNLTLTIETPGGIVLDSLNTGDIDPTVFPATWNQYAFFFTLPNNYRDVVMKIKNNLLKVPCGNDFALDDITIRPCMLSVAAAFANPNPLPDTLHFCESDKKIVQLNGTVQSGFEKTFYQWQESIDDGSNWTDITGANDPTQFIKTFVAAGKFQYRLTGSAGSQPAAPIACRTISENLPLLVDAVPVPKASNTSPVCLGAPINFSAQNAEFYQWSGPAGFTSVNPTPGIGITALDNNGKYYVKASTRGGCLVLDSTTVIVSDFPVANAGNDTTFCTGAVARLQATGGTSFLWTPATGLSAANIANPIVSLASTVTYSVTVGNQYNCTSKDEVVVKVASPPVASAGTDAAICKGNTTTLQASGALSYAWSPAAGLSNANIASPTASPTVTTSYVVKVTDASSCSSTDTVVISVYTKPFADAGPDRTLPEGQSVVLNGKASGDTSIYFWTPAQSISSPGVLTPVVNPTDDITYTLHVGSGGVCGVATDDVFIHIVRGFFAPNVFSPNGDGINDTWIIQAINRFPDADVKIFNRYGQQVFYSKGYAKPWDGRLNGQPLPLATYYYVIDRKNGQPVVSGSVLIVR